jgi:hypothetical protein
VVLRGGGWGNNPYCLRTAYRHGNPPDIGLDMVGFRCAGDKKIGAVLDKADYLGWRNEAKALSFNGKKAGTPA